MIPEEITEELKSGKSIDKVLKNHKTNLKVLFKNEPTMKSKPKPAHPKYYFFNKSTGQYIVNKRIDGKTVYFGAYRTSDEAAFAVELFKKYGWSKDNLWRIKAEVKEKLRGNS